MTHLGPALFAPLLATHPRTRRHWLPNVQTKRLYSETLDEMLKIKGSLVSCLSKTPPSSPFSLLPSLFRSLPSLPALLCRPLTHTCSIPSSRPVTTKALRCIKKAGGLDAYILRTKPEDLQSQFALELREKITAAKRRQATLVE